MISRYVSSWLSAVSARRIIAAVFAVVIAGSVAPTTKAQYGYPGQYGSPRYGQQGDPFQYAAQSGYQHGFDHGSSDRNRRKSFDVRRDDDYEDADRGYDRHMGISKDQYKRAFRDGYEQGYNDGYYGGDGYAPGYNRGTYNRGSNRGYSRFDWRRYLPF